MRQNLLRMCMKKYNLSQNDSKETIIVAQFKLVLTAYYMLLFMEPVLELPVMFFQGYAIVW